MGTVWLLAQNGLWWRGRSGAALELVLAAAVGAVVFWAATQLVRRVLRRTPWGIGEVLHDSLRPPAGVAIPLLFVMLARGRQQLSEPGAPAWPALDRVLQLAIIGVTTWLVAAAVGAVILFIKKRYRIDVPDNRESRRIHTQATIIGRSIQVVIMLVGVSLALMTFPRVQQLGTSLLASAGIIGLAVGLAARPVLENLIAGVQIGLAQPIRLDDVVVVDGEFGRVEEITLTYVVIRVWDERRLIVPFSKFLSDSFQNWTRSTARILGSVFIWVDYSAPVAVIRQEAERIVAGSSNWDGRTCSVQVTETTERTMQLRILVSAADAGKAFDLRAEVREKLVAFVQKEFPTVLPRIRVAPLSDPEAAGKERREPGGLAGAEDG